MKIDGPTQASITNWPTCPAMTGVPLSAIAIAASSFESKSAALAATRRPRFRRGAAADAKLPKMPLGLIFIGALLLLAATVDAKAAENAPPIVKCAGWVRSTTAAPCPEQEPEPTART
jgi:hypothetical protein